MHDHSLGGMVNVGTVEGVEHSGSCNDGVYGCSRCWNAANNGKGTISNCDWCKAETHTHVTRAWDEPVSYALCQGCGKKNRPSEEEMAELDRFHYDSSYDDDDEHDDY